MSLPVNSKFTKLDKNVKFSLECSKRIPDTINQLPWHLITFGICWPQELPVEHMVVLLNNKSIWEK